MATMGATDPLSDFQSFWAARRMSVGTGGGPPPASAAARTPAATAAGGLGLRLLDRALAVAFGGPRRLRSRSAFHHRGLGRHGLGIGIDRLDRIIGLHRIAQRGVDRRASGQQADTRNRD